MIKILLIITCILLTGCSDMTRKETIDAVKECEDAGMRPVVLNNGLTLGVRDVICDIKIIDKLKETVND